MSRLPPRLLAGILNLIMLAPGASGQARPKTEEIADRIVAMARSQVGQQEIQGKDNRGEMIDKYNLAAGGKIGDEWCAAFISWVMSQVDQENQHQLGIHKLEKLPQPVDFEKAAREMHILRDAKTYSPLPGDLLIFRWPNGNYHLEMVTEPENTKLGRIYTIGGNSVMISRSGTDEGVRESYFRRRPDGSVGYSDSTVIGVVDIRALLNAPKELKPKGNARMK